MSDEQLKEVADNMGLNKLNLTDRETAVYEILDQQAINSVATAQTRKATSDKPSRNEAKVRRGVQRRRKPRRARRRIARRRVRSPRLRNPSSPRPSRQRKLTEVRRAEP